MARASHLAGRGTGVRDGERGGPWVGRRAHAPAVVGGGGGEVDARAVAAYHHQVQVPRLPWAHHRHVHHALGARAGPGEARHVPENQIK